MPLPLSLSNVRLPPTSESRSPGAPSHTRTPAPWGRRAPAGLKIKVVFLDGETVVGTTQGYQPSRPGFFMVPADPDDNNERCYIVAAAAQSVTLL